MNYYERHLGDYAKDTAHLSMVEHGAYSLLLDRYYATEQPIPADQAHRIARARSKDERAAVDAVLAEFFTLTDGAWTSGRCEEEIAKARHRIESARMNGKSGGRPRKEPKQNPAGSDQKPSGLSLGSENETGSKALHVPDTTYQPSEPTVLQGERSTRSRPPARPDDVPEQTWGDWLALRKAKRAPVSATTLEEARKQSVLAGMTLEAFLRVWCRRGSQGLEASWLRAEERPSNVVPVESFRERDQRLAAERVAEFAPSVARRKAPTFDFEIEAVDVTPRRLG